MKSDIQSQLQEVFKRITGVTEVNPYLSQNNCVGWDSLRHIFLMVELESEFDITIEPDEIDEIKTYSDLERILLSKLQH